MVLRPETDVGTREYVKPDPSTLAAIGVHHSFSSALADLVDNSIDAGATHVRIRFLEQLGSIIGLQIIDNGKGMNSDEIRRAMTFGARRDYGSEDLGYFGLGLKAASLSQSESFAVFSRQEWSSAVGRFMDHSVSEDFSVGVLSSDIALANIEDTKGIEISSGTIVEWHQLKDSLNSTESDVVAEWKSTKIREIRHHLGLTFHRLLEDGVLSIGVDSFDVDRKLALPALSIEAIDPFKNSIHRGGYPRTYVANLPDGASFSCEGHIFPPKLNTTEFDLYGEPGERRQGFYLYRRNRLIATGDNWAGLRIPDGELGLGRVKLELDEATEKYVALNPEKIEPVFTKEFSAALRLSHSTDGENLPFTDFFDDLRRLQRDSRRSSRKPISLVEPGLGINPGVIDQLKEFQDFADYDPISIRFVTLGDYEFFRADRINRRIDLNVNIVRTLSGRDGRLTNSDGQLIKILLYFLLQDDFKIEQRWDAIRIERHRLINSSLISAFFDDFGSEESSNDLGD
ncbi:ATP-binding protein [Neomicrococcus lactis]|uniref:ATP-binding protein n=1 Tax=Neomicrococcus lactis TaxID=732241 RepID=A0A7W9DCK1_9MICC|nr:ATP-binding protein [Neomicrococcus lactis]MBB5598957.1 hypothetical protein [Neomicrococcus lactis]